MTILLPWAFSFFFPLVSDNGELSAKVARLEARVTYLEEDVSDLEAELELMQSSPRKGLMPNFKKEANE